MCCGLLHALREIFALPSALKFLHLAFSSSGRLMRVLGSIVTPSAALMASFYFEGTCCRWIRSKVIRDEFFWDKAIFLQKLAHEFKRRPLVPPALDQHIEHFALGVDGAPRIDYAAIDFEIDFVQMPSRIGLGSAFAQVRCDLRPKMVHPAPNSLV